MEPGQLSLLAFLGVALFALAAKWRDAFGILGLCSFLTGLFYGFVWVLGQGAIRDYRDMYGDLTLPPSHVPHALHSLVMDFETVVMQVIWGVGILLFLGKFISDLDRS